MREMKILNGVQDHWMESKNYFNEHNMVGIFLQGSQNYGLDTEDSDIDTKLIVTPTLNDIAHMYCPMSTTHIRENKEHTDFKDVRLMFNTFKKQNLNFIEILFTPYKIINPIYKDDWNKLVAANEEIAHYNPYAAVCAMRGLATGKRVSLFKETPDRKVAFEKYGYDPKQLYHLLRIEEYLVRYINGEKYINCLQPHHPEYLKAVKKGYYNKTQAELVSNQSVDHIKAICEPYTKESKFNKPDYEVLSLLYEVQESIIRKSLSMEV